ncbi:MAG: uroporphyrinogen decarboxylase [Bdellovibrionales bacterium]|nr:uroporphyrinogen decarboxylase [Bdellovibrionales bacterium]
MANTRFSHAMGGVPQDIPPIWMMRQAGRYHSHYQKMKEKYSFVELCKVPELAAETAMGPIEDFDFDVAILFSDLLFPLEALGMGLSYSPGPQLGWKLNAGNIDQLLPVEEAIGAMEFQKEAVKQTRERLPQDKSLIGFVGGPWTLFGYAVEGSHKGGLKEAKTIWNLVETFNQIMVPFLERNIQLQLDGGAELVMILDTAAGELSPLLFRQGIVPSIAQLANKFPWRLGYYSQGTQPSHIQAFQDEKLPLAGMGFDHRWDLPWVFSFLDKGEKRGFVQGNFDQSLLFQSPNDFEYQLDSFLSPFLEMEPADRVGWVCGLGHGILPGTPERNVRRFVQKVRETFQ